MLSDPDTLLAVASLAVASDDARRFFTGHRVMRSRADGRAAE